MSECGLLQEALMSADEIELDDVVAVGYYKAIKTKNNNIAV